MLLSYFLSPLISLHFWLLHDYATLASREPHPSVHRHLTSSLHISTSNMDPPDCFEAASQVSPTSPVLAHLPNELATWHGVRETSSWLAKRSRTALIIEWEWISWRMQGPTLSLAVVQEWPSLHGSLWLHIRFSLTEDKLSTYYGPYTLCRSTQGGMLGVCKLAVMEGLLTPRLGICTYGNSSEALLV